MVSCVRHHLSMQTQVLPTECMGIAYEDYVIQSSSIFFSSTINWHGYFRVVSVLNGGTTPLNIIFIAQIIKMNNVCHLQCCSKMIQWSDVIYLHSMAPPGVQSIQRCARPPNELSAGGRACSVMLSTASSLRSDISPAHAHLFVFVLFHYIQCWISVHTMDVSQYLSSISCVPQY